MRSIAPAALPTLERQARLDRAEIRVPESPQGRRFSLRPGSSGPILPTHALVHVVTKAFEESPIPERLLKGVEEHRRDGYDFSARRAKTRNVNPLCAHSHEFRTHRRLVAQWIVDTPHIRIEGKVLQDRERINLRDRKLRDRYCGEPLGMSLLSDLSTELQRLRLV